MISIKLFTTLCCLAVTIAGAKELFESAEHEAIGDRVHLKYDGSVDLLGKDFGYVVNQTNTLSFGLIVALAGDFYANWTPEPGDVEQVSDNWGTNNEQSITLAVNIASTLSNDTKNYLSSILSTMNSQRSAVLAGIQKGQDPAQIYKKDSDKGFFGSSDTKYFFNTNTGYLFIALCNWDHFGQDAVNAYSAFHTAALRKAKEAHDGDQSQVKAVLNEAYFLEAFGQHFLTDLFSTGHLRAPRRILHQNKGSSFTSFFSLNAYPADKSLQMMHDEDCANGLWVTNQQGDSWAAYGDKQMLTGKSARDYMQAVKAAQAGVDEVWETRQSGNEPSAENFSALKMIPLLNNIDQSNYVPLFQWNNSTRQLHMRTELDQRYNPRTNTVQVPQSNSAWSNLLKKITASGGNRNMYPFSQGFLSSTNIWHIRQAENSTMILNKYGPVDSADYGTWWSMVSRSSLSNGNTGTVKWTTAKPLSDGTWSLVGRTQPHNTTYHLGLHITNNASSAQIVWNATETDGNAAWKEGDVVYGNFGKGSPKTGMVKHWTRGTTAKLELWSLASSLRLPPVKLDDSNVKFNTGIAPLNFMLAYKVDPSDNFQTFIGYSQPTRAHTTWYFSYWDEVFSNPTSSTYNDTTATTPARALLAGKFGNDDRLVRVLYGSGHNNLIHIDVLRTERNAQQQVIPSIVTKQDFPISWGSNSPDDYLTWFLADVNGDNRTDLVALTVSDREMTLRVVVFPGNSNSGFTTPQVSYILIPTSKGTLLNAAFMTHVHASQAKFTYLNPANTTQSQGESSAGILAFFDNYGILGARMMAPVSPSGTFSYEFKGQTPAIAGQSSQGLGIHGKDWMGRGERSHTIGFILDDPSVTQPTI